MESDNEKPMIRREDKEIIQNLALLGMLFGAFVGVFLTLHMDRKARQQQDVQAATAQTQSSLVRLSSSLPTEEVQLAQAALGQFQDEDTPDIESETIDDNFWLGLPRWKLWGICAGAGLVGGTAGFFTLWGAGWLGSIWTYWLIRRIYGAIRTAAPDCAAARRTVSPRGAECPFQRDNNRLLPTLIKLCMLLLTVLGVLAIAVWHLTAI